MKDCKCGRIPPCYGSLEFAIYEEAKKVNDEWKKSRALHGKLIDKLRNKLMEGGFLDDTHAKVYGVNKQMCDIGKTMNDPMKPLSEEAIQEIAKALEITRKPKGIIMEKKTKKMTKAEAFEYLKGKKVLCYSSKMGVVQGFVKSLGFHWSDYSEEPMLVSILFLGEDGRLTYSVSLKRFEEHESPEISADDILSIEIVEEKKEPLDRWEEFASKVAKIQETLEDDEVCIITKTNFLTMTK